MLFDYAIDKDKEGQFRALAEKLREKGMDQGDEARVKGKGKGKEIIFRYNGETIEGEHEAVVRDPRKDAKVKKAQPLRPYRTQLARCKWEVRGTLVLLSLMLTFRSTMGTRSVRLRPRASS